jgi:hypothetical protein
MDAVRGVDASVEHERAWRASMQRGGLAKVHAKSERLPRASTWYVRRELHADTSYSQGHAKSRVWHQRTKNPTESLKKSKSTVDEI